MDCCNYGEYRTHGQYGAGAGAGWEGYGAYAPLPYAPYTNSYYAPHAHDPYARYYRYDYPGHHMHHAEHVMPMEYGVYVSKEARVRRPLPRRDQRAHSSAQHLPLPPTPPLECGMNGRGSTYCDPQMWPHYPMGVIGSASGWSNSQAMNVGWTSRSSCSREHKRYPPDCHSVKGPSPHIQNSIRHSDARSTNYHDYERQVYNGDSSRLSNTTEFDSGAMQMENNRVPCESSYIDTRRPLLEEKRPPVVPLPAFQQAFGSTEIGKFSEAFTRTEVAQDDVSGDSFMFESFPEWDGSNEPQWSSQPAAKEIKCEDSY